MALDVKETVFKISKWVDFVQGKLGQCILCTGKAGFEPSIYAEHQYSPKSLIHQRIMVIFSCCSCGGERQRFDLARAAQFYFPGVSISDICRGINYLEKIAHDAIEEAEAQTAPNCGDPKCQDCFPPLRPVPSDVN